MEPTQFQNVLILVAIAGFALMEFASRRYQATVHATANDTKLELFMFVSLVALTQPLVILATQGIGATWFAQWQGVWADWPWWAMFGLLLLGAPFGFIALLGFLSLSGMLVKNCIVLLEQINLERSEGKAAFNAVFDSAVSRVRPVSMAAITTILGMLPLLGDDFFASLAVVIMFGLGFATVLTLVFLPVLYCSMFKIKTVQEPQ